MQNYKVVINDNSYVPSIHFLNKMALLSNDCICRTCLSQGLLKSVFEKTCLTNFIDLGNQIFLSEMIMECTSVKVARNDNLPSGICEKCVFLLKQAYMFKKQCENSDATLRSHIEEQSLVLPKSNAKSEMESQFYFCKVKSETTESFKLESNEYSGRSVFSCDNDCQFSCDTCGSNYPTEYELYRHVENEHFNVKLTQYNSEIIHIIKSLPEIINDSMTSSNIKSEYDVSLTDNDRYDTTSPEMVLENCQLNCSNCSKSFVTVFELRKHAEKKHNLILTAKNKKSRCTKSKHIKKNPKKSETVAVSIFESGSTTTAPIISSGPAERSYACETCGRRFSRPEYVKRHNNIHTGEKIYVCEVCNNTFSHLASLKYHLKVHSGEAAFMCDHCGKSYRTKTLLLYHIRQKHTELPSNDKAKESHVCQICNRSYKSQKGLFEHAVRHGEKKCLCHECGKAFLNRNELAKHSRVHSGLKPYKCVTCDKSFAQMKNLKIHMLSHTEEKSIQCKLCDRAFKLPQYLRDHMRTHTGEKPYSCKICNKKFPYYKSLTVHRRTHIGGFADTNVAS